MEYGSYCTDIDEPTTMDHPSWTTRVFGHLQGEYCEETHSVIIDASGQGAACSVGKVYNEAQRVVSDLAFVMVTYLDGPVQLAAGGRDDQTGSALNSCSTSSVQARPLFPSAPSFADPHVLRSSGLCC